MYNVYHKVSIYCYITLRDRDNENVICYSHDRETFPMRFHKTSECFFDNFLFRVQLLRRKLLRRTQQIAMIYRHGIYQPKPEKSEAIYTPVTHSSSCRAYSPSSTILIRLKPPFVRYVNPYINGVCDIPALRERITNTEYL